MKLTWTKEGGYDGSNFIRYTAATTNLTILRTRHKGTWGLPSLYRDDRFVRGFLTVADAKKFAETLVK